MHKTISISSPLHRKNYVSWYASVSLNTNCFYSNWIHYLTIDWCGFWLSIIEINGFLECHPNSMECTHNHFRLIENICGGNKTFKWFELGSVIICEDKSIPETNFWWIQMWKCILVDSMKHPLLSRWYDSQISWESVPTCRSNSHYKQILFLSICAWEKCIQSEVRQIVCTNWSKTMCMYSNCWTCILMHPLTRCKIQKPNFRTHCHIPNHIVHRDWYDQHHLGLIM